MAFSITALRITTLGITALSIMTVSIMTLSIMTLSIMALSIMPLSIMPLSIMDLIATFSINDNQYILSMCHSFYKLHVAFVFMPSVVMQNVVGLNVAAPNAL
jgi:hypothetical protein